MEAGYNTSILRSAPWLYGQDGGEMSRRRIMAGDVQQYDPFQQAMSLRDAKDRLLRESFVSPGMMFTTTGEVNLPLDVLEDPDGYVIHASLPGLRPEDVQLNLQGSTLSIRGQAPQTAEEKGN